MCRKADDFWEVFFFFSGEVHYGSFIGLNKKPDNLPRPFVDFRFELGDETLLFWW